MEETGEIRPPLHNEDFLTKSNRISLAYYNFSDDEIFSVLRVTENTDNDKVPSFDEWNW